MYFFWSCCPYCQCHVWSVFIFFHISSSLLGVLFTGVVNKLVHSSWSSFTLDDSTLHEVQAWWDFELWQPCSSISNFAQILWISFEFLAHPEQGVLFAIQNYDVLVVFPIRIMALAIFFCHVVVRDFTRIFI